MIALWISASLLGLALLLFLTYLLLLARPCRRRKMPPCLLQPYAHRGLHDSTLPENSLAAFAAAVDHGYGIELDVQLSSDGTVMVFHDSTLSRMTGRSEPLSALDTATLRSLSLSGTAETIPTLAEVLALVNGRVPLLIELKGESTDTTLCQHVAALLATYQGPYCIESFNPLLVRRIRQLIPSVPCGLLYTNVCRDKKKRSLRNLALTAMALNVLVHPDFIAYNQADRHSFPVALTTRFYRAPRFVWTVRSPEELSAAVQENAVPIFESVLPH